MNAVELKQIVERRKKRVGRGHGSGKVKTGGRGTKGQNARDSMPIGFEGGQLPLIKRLPLLRGKGKNSSQKGKAYPISVSRLADLPAKSIVSLETLRKYHMIEQGITRVKVLGGGELTHAYTVKVPVSMTARRIIEKAGGSVEA